MKPFMAARTTGQNLTAYDGTNDVMRQGGPMQSKRTRIKEIASMYWMLRRGELSPDYFRRQSMKLGLSESDANALIDRIIEERDREAERRAERVSRAGNVTTGDRVPVREPEVS